jgi:hypothetical protein
MMIVASQLFDTDGSPTILHMLRPSFPHLKLLFHENPDLNHVLVTDCREPLFQADIKRIEAERKFKTHIAGAFFVQRSMLDLVLPSIQHAPTWTELLQTIADES